MDSLMVTALAVLVAVGLTLVVHEIGHVVAALCLRLTILAISVGGEPYGPPRQAFGVTWMRGRGRHPWAAVHIGAHRGRHLRTRLAVFWVSGSVANLLLALAALGMLEHGVRAPTSAVLVLALVANGFFGILNLLPLGAPNDGQSLRDLASDRDRAVAPVLAGMWLMRLRRAEHAGGLDSELDELRRAIDEADPVEDDLAVVMNAAQLLFVASADDRRRLKRAAESASVVPQVQAHLANALAWRQLAPLPGEAPLDGDLEDLIAWLEPYVTANPRVYTLQHTYAHALVLAGRPGDAVLPAARGIPGSQEQPPEVQALVAATLAEALEARGSDDSVWWRQRALLLDPTSGTGTLQPLPVQAENWTDVLTESERRAVNQAGWAITPPTSDRHLRRRPYVAAAAVAAVVVAAVAVWDFVDSPPQSAVPSAYLAATASMDEFDSIPTDMRSSDPAGYINRVGTALDQTHEALDQLHAALNDPAARTIEGATAFQRYEQLARAWWENWEEASVVGQDCKETRPSGAVLLRADHVHARHCLERAAQATRRRVAEDLRPDRRHPRPLGHRCP